MKNILTPIILFISGVLGISTYVPTTTPAIQTKISSNIEKKVSTTTTSSKKSVPAKTTTATKPKNVSKSAQINSVKNSTNTLTNTNSKKQNNTTVNALAPVVTEPEIPFETINENVRKSIVNILCNTKGGSGLSPITGSGVIISSDGVILTNSHIAQFFLLKDFNGQKNSVECVIRTGNPAYPKYKAELVYISSSWINENKTILIDQNPQGTGEHDYAFLRITEKIGGEKITDKFSFSPISILENNTVGKYSLLASYPAGFLGGQSILQDLYQSSAITQISQVYTFGTNTIDLISIPGTIVSQKGSSGGGVVNSKGELIGIISTESEADKTSDRDLRAITTSYINRDLKNESSSTIIDILAFPTEYAKNFNENIAPKLTEILTNAILKK